MCITIKVGLTCRFLAIRPPLPCTSKLLEWIASCPYQVANSGSNMLESSDNLIASTVIDTPKGFVVWFKICLFTDYD